MQTFLCQWCSKKILVSLSHKSLIISGYHRRGNKYVWNIYGVARFGLYVIFTYSLLYRKRQNQSLDPCLLKVQSSWSCTTVHIREKCVKGPDSRMPLIQERGRSLAFNYGVDITEQKDCQESLAENKRGQINQAKWNSMESSITLENTSFYKSQPFGDGSGVFYSVLFKGP